MFTWHREYRADKAIKESRERLTFSQDICMFSSDMVGCSSFEENRGLHFNSTPEAAASLRMKKLTNTCLEKNREIV